MENKFPVGDPIRQLAIKVVSFSSQYGGENSRTYGALNLVGNGNIFPNYGDYTQAFVLRTYGPWWDIAPSGKAPINKKAKRNVVSEDFVDLEFQEYVIPTKIEILETFNPGAVVRILALLWGGEDSSGASCGQRWTILWSGEPQKCPSKARKFSPQLKKTQHPIKNYATMLELDLQSCNSKSLSQGWMENLNALKNLKKINLYRVSQVTDYELNRFFHSKKGLQHLNLGGCASFLDGDRLMESLNVFCRDLVSLDLWRNKGLTPDGVICLADGCILLQELDIGWW
ncbi:PREDICTED: F-box/LRR-repeat protein 4-like [Acropora digitifera]|uniref:F-box/LRR-repeat protein 4-like n=1 Tax=Acropora digitifera TaxID=70779 RepID=UPI00077B048E|nr:PREDICTED: F-box/LRR-repeat protein 4-like [Acropora digitifera]